MQTNIGCVVFLFLFQLDLSVVFATLHSVTGDFIFLNYCEENAKVPSYEWDNINSGSIPSISMTDYVARKFRLHKIKNLSCKITKNETVVIILSSEDVIDDTKSNLTYLNQTNRINNLITPKGMLKYGDHYYHPEEYCVVRITNDELELKVCEIDCKNKLTPCIYTCCPLGEVFDFSINSCQYSGQREWFHYERLAINCSSQPGSHQEIWVFRKVKQINKLKAKILKDGSLQYIGPERRWKVLPGLFCVTGIQNYDDSHPYSYYTGEEDDQLVSLCNDGRSKDTTTSPYYAAAMLISSLFLLLTIIVYILLWDKQNVHGWTIVSLVTSMFFFFLFLSTAHFMGKFNDTPHSGTIYCVGIGVLAHFFFLSTFCWLSVLNFDVWWTLRCNAPLSNRSKGLKRFCLYIVFAWGVPTVVICVAFILTHFFPDRESLVIIPQYGVFSCFVAEGAQGVYIYFILGILFLWNFLFMSLTFFTLYQFQKGTSVIRSASTHQHNSFRTLVKLFIVMGVTWCFEFISWWNTETKLPWYWVVIDFVNVFQAIGIFVIFVCKRQIMKQLQATHPIFKRFSLKSTNQNQSSTTTLHTRSSLKTDATTIKMNTQIIKNIKKHELNNAPNDTKL